MSRKIECPGCEVYTSAVATAFDSEDPCPYCGLPHDAAVAVLRARERGARLSVRVEEDNT